MRVCVLFFSSCEGHVWEGQWWGLWSRVKKLMFVYLLSSHKSVLHLWNITASQSFIVFFFFSLTIQELYNFCVHKPFTWHPGPRDWVCGWKWVCGLLRKGSWFLRRLWIRLGFFHSPPPTPFYSFSYISLACSTTYITL